MSQPSSPIPSELLSLKSLKTLSGASITVWIVCLVVASLLPEDTLKYWHFRIIAFILSVLITITIIAYKQYSNKLAYWLLVLGNTCYIFINASGINSISKNQLFSKSPESKTDTTTNDEGFYKGKRNTPIMTGFFSFVTEADWWPDKEILYENTTLKQELISLKSNNSVVFTERDSLREKASDLEGQIKTLMDSKSANEKSLINQVNNLTDQIKKLTASFNDEKNKNTDLTKSLNTCTQNYEDSIKKISTQSKEINNLRGQVRKLKNDSATLSRSLAIFSQNYEDCKKNMNKAEEKLKTCSQEIDRLNRALNKAKADLKQAQADLKKCRETIG